MSRTIAPEGQPIGCPFVVSSAAVRDQIDALALQPYDAIALSDFVATAEPCDVLALVVRLHSDRRTHTDAARGADHAAALVCDHLTMRGTD